MLSRKGKMRGRGRKSANRIAVLLIAAVFAVGALWAFMGRSDVDTVAVPEPTGEVDFWHEFARVGEKGRIAIVAPSSGLSERDAEKAHELAGRIGACFPREAVAFDRVPYHATDDRERLTLLADALNDPEVRVVWALRGGYGSGRLLEHLSRYPLPERPKIFIGYSDLTFVHLYLQRAGWRTVHGAMFRDLSVDGKSAENFRLLAGLLSGRIGELRYDGLQPFNQAAREARTIEAPLAGGNLTCLAAATGTRWPPEAEGRILFIEEVGEPGYRVDRMLTQLGAAGRLDGVAAVLFGTFQAGDDHTEYALERFAKDFDRPVFRSGLFGHGPDNYPLVFNAPASIEPAADGTSFTLRIDARLP